MPTNQKAVETMDVKNKKRDAEEMIRLYLRMSELDRAKTFGYAQGVASGANRMDMQRAV